jgi:hypothetical protein
VGGVSGLFEGVSAEEGRGDGERGGSYHGCCDLISEEVWLV